jgi:AcrR family transcriptional regulator
LAKATTKEIARAAGFSEATLYKHFEDKEEIFVEILRSQVPSFAPLLKTLIDNAGQGTVRDGLITAARAALDFYHDSFLMLASTFSEPSLLARHREALGRRNVGPHRAIDGLASYLRKEQELGRVAADANPEASSALLLGACFQHVFLAQFAGRDPAPDEFDTTTATLVDTVLRTL